MPHIISNSKRKRLKHYSRNKIYNNCKCQEKIKPKSVEEEKKIKKEEQQKNMEDIVQEVFV